MASKKQAKSIWGSSSLLFSDDVDNKYRISKRPYMKRMNVGADLDWVFFNTIMFRKSRFRDDSDLPVDERKIDLKTYQDLISVVSAPAPIPLRVIGTAEEEDRKLNVALLQDNTAVTFDAGQGPITDPHYKSVVLPSGDKAIMITDKEGDVYIRVYEPLEDSTLDKVAAMADTFLKG